MIIFRWNPIFDGKRPGPRIKLKSTKKLGIERQAQTNWAETELADSNKMIFKTIQ